MTPTSKIRPPVSGVDTATLFATLIAVRANPETAKFQFSTTNRWQGGAHSRSTIRGFSGAGPEDASRTEDFTDDGDGPTPVEFLLDALTAGLTAGIANIAAARGVTLHSVSATVEGDIDLRGILGQPDDVRNGRQAIRVNFHISGDAPPHVLTDLVEQSGARSAVYDVLSTGVAISVEVSSDRPVAADSAPPHVERRG
jgi:uncharacterized OsmC-like protein